jgi:hypothetical protein
MVKWLYQDDGKEEYVYVAERLLLFARCSNNEDECVPAKIVAVIHSLTAEYYPLQNSLLFFAKGDTLDKDGIDVIEATAIEETAFVLPNVKQQGSDFLTSHETAKYFLVFPPWSKWSKRYLVGGR